MSLHFYSDSVTSNIPKDALRHIKLCIIRELMRLFDTRRAKTILSAFWPVRFASVENAFSIDLAPLVPKSLYFALVLYISIISKIIFCVTFLVWKVTSTLRSKQIPSQSEIAHCSSFHTQAGRNSGKFANIHRQLIFASENKLHRVV